jgi:pimeloyl-ACP methyl ester carboxylesterase
MAGDAVAVLDDLGIERAHVVGASMGGMIAQTMAIEFPERVASLTSIMSTTGDRDVGQPTNWPARARGAVRTCTTRRDSAPRRTRPLSDPSVQRDSLASSSPFRPRVHAPRRSQRCRSARSSCTVTRTR